MLLDEYGKGARRARRARASTARSRTGSRPTATRRSSTRRSLRRARARPVGLHRATPARPPRRWTATASSSRALITDFNTTAGAFAREDGNLQRGGRRAAAHAARRAARAGRAQRRVPAAARAGRGPAAGRASSAARRSTPRCRSCASCAAWSPRPELRGLAADLRPTVPALAAPDRAQRAAVRAGPPRRRAARTRSILPWTKDTVAGQAVPGRGPGLRGGAEAAARPRRREPLGRRQRPVVPRAGRRRHEPRHARRPACSPPRPAAASAPTRRKPHERPPLNARRRRARPRSTPDLRSHPGRAAAAAAQVDTDSPRVPGALRARRARKAVEWLDASSSRSRASTGTLKVADEDATPAADRPDRRQEARPMTAIRKHCEGLPRRPRADRSSPPACRVYILDNQRMRFP